MCFASWSVHFRILGFFVLHHFAHMYVYAQQRIENSSVDAKDKKAIANYTSEVGKLRKWVCQAFVADAANMHSHSALLTFWGHIRRWGLDSSLHLFEKQHVMQRQYVLVCLFVYSAL